MEVLEVVQRWIASVVKPVMTNPRRLRVLVSVDDDDDYASAVASAFSVQGSRSSLLHAPSRVLTRKREIHGSR